MPANAIILLYFTDGAQADWGCNRPRSEPARANTAAKPQDAFPPLQHFSLAKLVPGLQEYFPLSISFLAAQLCWSLSLWANSAEIYSFKLRLNENQPESKQKLQIH